jgi:hypothetical protein
MALKSRIPIPKLYKTKKLEINGQEIEIRGYRFIDEEFVVPLRQAAYDLSTISKKMEDATGKTIHEIVDSEDESDNKYTLKQVEQVGEVGKEIEALRGQTEELQYKLAQRGLKRFYYDGTTEELDDLPDIDIDIEDAALIANTMISLTSSRQVKGKKGKKQKGPASKENSKPSEK